MPGNTPIFALPYPLPTDQVSQGAADIQALALAVEPVLANAVEAPGTGRWRLHAGTIAVAASVHDQVLLPAAAFPEAFAAVPTVILSLELAGNNGGDSAVVPAAVWLYAHDAAGLTAAVRNLSTAPLPAGAIVVHWLAFGPR